MTCNPNWLAEQSVVLKHTRWIISFICKTHSPLDLYMLKYICRILIIYICRNILLTLENECASSSKHAFSHSIRHLHSLLMVISPFHFGILPKIKSLSTKNKGMSNRCELHSMIMDVFTTLSFGKNFGK